MREHRNVVILDLDDTLGNFRDAACNAFNKKYNKQHTFKEWEHHLIEQLYGITKEEFISNIIELNILENIEPHEEVVEFTKKLKDNGYIIIVLTARSWHPEAASITHNWLRQHNISYTCISLCDVTDSKADLLYDIEKTFGKIAFVVDDSSWQLENYLKTNISNVVYIYDMPWNKDKLLDILGGKRISNLTEIVL